MDANQALGELKEISAQIHQAVIFAADGTVIASTLGDEERAAAMADAAKRLLAAAEEAAPARERPLTQLEAAGAEGSIALVREGDRAVAATTRPDPTIGLVLYDLRTCLRASAVEPEPKKRTRRTARTTKAAEGGDEAA